MLQARPGKEVQPLAQDEEGTLNWYDICLGPRKYGIVDTFANGEGRNTHLAGEIAKALMAQASELFAIPRWWKKLRFSQAQPYEPNDDSL